jgi:mRNA interferase MazF
MKRGTIVLTIFPFTDLTTVKRRPALIVSNPEQNKEDVIVAFISTIVPERLSPTDLVFDACQKEFAASGLKKKSVFRLDKLATLKKSIFTGELGSVGQETLHQENEKLKTALGLI